MARSLTVTQEENPSTSPLFLGFLLFAVAWLAATALVAAPADATSDVDANATIPSALP